MAVVISEFLADNGSGLTDVAGERQDWIELANNGATSESIGGWYLTDDSADLTKWQIPLETTLAAGQRLVVFASGKNLTGAQLHTNFSLSASGEDLALVRPDGTTIEDAYLAYPAQLEDISYGRGVTGNTSTATTLVGASSTVKAYAPTSENAAIDDHWLETSFNDAAWLTGTRSVGFDRNSDGVNLSPYIGRVLTTGEMSNTQTTAYIRYSFNVADKEQLTSLVMNLRFDDGFIMYLNGREVARANFAEDFVRPQPQWDSFAGNQVGTGSTAGAANRVAEALDVATFDLTAYLPEIVNGTNVLAFHGVNSNSTASSSTNRQDFFIDPVLTATRATGAVNDVFMAAPTPGTANGLGVAGFVADTKFSVDRGFYQAAFQLSISSATPGAVIRYTTDGSLPSATQGTLYSGPITINSTTTLRAVAYKAGFAPANVDTVTYVFLDDVLTQSASDVTQPYAPWGHDKDDAGTESGYNLDDESDWEMDPDIVSGNEQAVKNALTSIPTMSLVMDWDDLFSGAPMPGTFPAGTTAAPQPQGIYIHGTSTERFASLEYINPNAATDTFHLDVGVEMQGHSSTLRWNSDKMSFQVKFKFPYGPTELNYPLFGDALFGAGAATEFDTLILDAAFNYSWHHQNPIQRDYARFVSDQVVADLQNLASGNGAAHGKYVHLYLNGMYWGLYNVHERPDDSFATEYYGGSKDDYDVIKHSTNENLSAGGHRYSSVEGGIAAEQRFAALLNATEAVRSNPTNAALYQTVAGMLDVDQFIDYVVVLMYGGNDNDWPHNNWYATFNRVDDEGRWRFHAWDQEHAFPTTDNGDAFDQFTDPTVYESRDSEGPGDLFHDLIENAEFRLRFNDRVEALLRNGGVLTPAAAAAVYQARIDEITSAIVGESARWGDNRNSTAPYKQEDFLAVNNAVIAEFFSARTTSLLGHFQARGWLASLAAPVFDNYGGTVPQGQVVSISKALGAPVGAVIYYTTDGTDPRLPSGAANPAAMSSPGPLSLTINSGTRVMARIKSGADWSPLVDAAYTLADRYPLRIVELMYNPVGSGDEIEYFELLNVSSSTIDLTNVSITDFSAGGYSFAGGTLGAGERIVVVKDQAAFAAAYPGVTNVAPGVFSGSLANEGETVSLRGPLGELLQSFIYGDSNVAGWPAAADGDGHSLEYIGPLDQDLDNPAVIVGDPYDTASNWRASTQVGGTPGSDGASTPLAGDYDANGVVDSLDYEKWRTDFGLAVTLGAGADGNGNGLVDAADYSIWRDNLGATSAAVASAAGFGSFAAVDSSGATLVGDGDVAEQGSGSILLDLEQPTSILAPSQASIRYVPLRNLSSPAVIDRLLTVIGRPSADTDETSADVVEPIANLADREGYSKDALIWEDDAWIGKLRNVY